MMLMYLASSIFKQTKWFVELLCAQQKRVVTAVFVFLLSMSAYAVPPGTVITNIATANYDVSGNPQLRQSNTIDVVTTANLTPASISFLQFSPTGSGATPINSSSTACSMNSASGPFTPLPDPNYLGLGPLNVFAPLDLAPATAFHQGEPIFVRVVDTNRNLDSAIRDTLEVTIRSTNVGDQERIQLSETDVNTGEFVGFIQSVTTPTTPFDCVLAVITNEQIEVSYTDIFDNTDVVSTNILVDPFGIVFNSTTGEPIDGITVTLINAATNAPAAVFGDDLISAYPSTVVTGSTVTDAGNTVYNFGPGEYRFPSVAPGTYRIDVITDEFVVPSIVGEAELQTLPNAPFAIDANASFGQEFILVIGPPLNVDVPIDPVEDALFVNKRASKQEVAIGDFIQYEVTVTNNRSTTSANNVQVIDRLPTGFRYQHGSVRVDGVETQDPNISSDGQTLTFDLSSISAAQSATVKYVLEVTSGAPFGGAVNSAFATDGSQFTSNVAQAVVTVIDDLISTRSFLIGRVTQGSCEDQTQENNVIKQGVEGIRLILEDGRYVLTDQRGLYHFEGLEPGTHVVQLDPATIPAHLEIAECISNTRFAGGKYSRFVDIEPGILWRANFYLREKQAPQANLHSELIASLENEELVYRLNLSSGLQSIQNIRASVILPEGLAYVESSSSLNGEKTAEPRNAFGTLIYSLGDRSVSEWQDQLAFKVERSNESISEFKAQVIISYDQAEHKNQRTEVLVNNITLSIASGKTLIASQQKAQALTKLKTLALAKTSDAEVLPVIKVEATPEFDKAWLDQANNELAWLLPLAKANPEISSVDIAIKHKRDEKIILILNGGEVSNLHLDSKLSSTDGQRMITRWRGVGIVEGDNKFTAVTYNKDDQEQDRVTQVVHYSGQPVKAELVPEYSRLQADGRSPVVIAVRFYDRWGHPARPGVVGNYDLSPDYTDSQLKQSLDTQPLNGLLGGQTRYRILQDGIALIQIEPTTRSGKVELDFEFIDNRKQTVTAWLKANAQDWVLVGLAEGTAGYNNLSGNAEALDDHQFEDNLYEDGRLAFYGKGRVKGEWLLTLAYDSNRKERNSPDRLFQTIDPDEYYTLYGDATEQQFDAASARKLYLRLEREQFYALFGDFNTDLTVTELSRYSRSFTGVKSEFEGERFGFNAFVADSDQVFVRDELQGNGTSGLYRLSNGDIVINSEKVRLETRDRFRPQIVISEQNLNQFTDYSIDTLNGTLFFKQPIQSRDENFNPIFIVVDYEVIGANDRQVSAGGRVNIFSKDKKLEVGVSGILQGDTSTKGDLLGVDASYQINDQTEARIELAKSKTTIDDNKQSSTAYLAEIDHISEHVDASAYFRRQASGFGLQQQSANNDGSKRYGVDARYKIKEGLTLNGQAYRDEALSEDNKRSVAEVEIVKSENLYQLGAGIRYAKDQRNDADDDDSLLATAQASRYLLDSKLQVRANAEFELGNDNSVDHPTRYIAGADYKLNEITDLFVEHEYTQGEDQDTNTTRVGTRINPWSQATIDTSVSQQLNENGERLFSNLGFTQGWQYNENLSFDFSLDRSDTLRNPGGQPLNSNVGFSSGTVSDDFTAASVGANYTQDDWAMSSRFEVRTSDADVQRGLFLGFYKEQDTGFGMAFDAQIFDNDGRDGSEQTQIDMNYSVAYRPDDSPFTVLNRLDVNYDNTISDDSRIRTRKAVNNLNLNYALDYGHQLGVHWGIKYTLDNIDGEEFDGLTQLLGFQYQYDLSPRLDLSLHGDVLHSTNSDNLSYSFGPAIGANVYKNVWLSVGYNVEGFEDDDFTSADFTANGPYIKMRVKFDADTVRGLLGR